MDKTSMIARLLKQNHAPTLGDLLLTRQEEDATKKVLVRDWSLHDEQCRLYQRVYASALSGVATLFDGPDATATEAAKAMCRYASIIASQAVDDSSMMWQNERPSGVIESDQDDPDLADVGAKP